MLAALTTFPPRAETETMFVSRPSSPGGTFDELSQVTVTVNVSTIEDDVVLAGATGTVVAVWDDRETYDVEFVGALGPATISGTLLKPV